MNKSVGEKGGIDYNLTDLNLMIQSSGSNINFHLDSAQLQHMQNSAGFSPVIIGIQPISSLNGFLGLADEPALAKPAANAASEILPPQLSQSIKSQ